MKIADLKAWGAGGRKFESSHPDHWIEKSLAERLRTFFVGLYYMEKFVGDNTNKGEKFQNFFLKK